MNDFGNGLLVALGIGFLIFVHELGHYLAARRVGARVEVFSLGFGPRVFGFRRGPTDYRLSLIPLGGYVAVAGQDPGDHRYAGNQSLHQKSVGARMLFFSGGVVMNVLFALVAFPIAFGAGVSFPAPVIGHVEPGGGAWEARLQPGTRVLAIDGKHVYSFDNLMVEVALAGGRTVQLQIERDGQTSTVEVRPQFRADMGLYGIGIDATIEATPPRLAVDDDGPGARAGLRTGDQLLAIDGHSMVGHAALTTLATVATVPGSKRTVRVVRDGAEQTFEVTPVPEPTPGPLQIGVLPLARVVAGLRPSALVEALGLQRGDVLLDVDGVPYTGQGLAAAASATAGAGGPLRLRVLRDRQELRLHAEADAAERQGIDEFVALTGDLQSAAVMPTADGAAAAAGLQPGDRVLRIDGIEVDDWHALRSRVLDAESRALQLDVERAGATAADPVTQVHLTVTPRARPMFDYGYVPELVPLRNEVRAAGFGDALRLGSVCALDLVKQLYVTMKRLLTGDVAAKNLGGIIQISRTSYQNTQWGLPRFLYFLALLSINLAFINVLPIPVLDGGHLLFLFIEKIKGSPVSVRVLNYSQILGLVMVLALVVFVTYNDILRLL